MAGLEGYLRQHLTLTNPLGRDKAISKTKYKEDFVDIMNRNLRIVDNLVDESKKLAKAGKSQESDRLLTIAENVLDSNKKLQSMVVDVLSKLD